MSSATLKRYEGEKMANAVAMYVILVSLSMLFATMFLALAVYRLTAEVWPPGGAVALPRFWPGVSSLIAILSSACFMMFEKDFEGPKARVWLTLSTALGGAFLFSQMNLWSSLEDVGILASSGVYGSLVYVFTWVHFAHILVGVLALLWLSLFMKKLKTDGRRSQKVKNIGKFWHFLGVIWLSIYLVIFIL